MTRAVHHTAALVTLVALAAVALAACSPDLGPAGEWTAWDAIEAPLTPELRVALAEPPLPGPTLRIVTFNVEKGEDPEGIAAAISADAELARADVFLLQEIESHPGEGGSRAARLAAALGVGYVYAPARRETDGTHGLAILTRWPLENVRVMQLPFADLSFKTARRIALAADLQTQNGPLHLITVHLDTRMNVTERILQLRPAVLDASDPIVVAGDFNTNPYVWADGTVPLVPAESIAGADQGAVLDDYMRALDFETPTAQVGATQHVAGLEFRLDAIYTRAVATGTPHVATGVDVSDHWPLWVDVTVAP